MTLKQLRKEGWTDIHPYLLELCDCGHNRTSHRGNDTVKWWGEANEDEEVGVGACEIPPVKGMICSCGGFRSFSTFIKKARKLNS